MFQLPNKYINRGRSLKAFHLTGTMALRASADVREFNLLQEDEMNEELTLNTIFFSSALIP